jgi:transcriptional/translational regulatory protein YebC/TACO1
VQTLAGNPILVDAIQKAKKTPEAQLEHRLGGQADPASSRAVDYQTIIYEGYAAGGAALLIECLTDNKNAPRRMCAP